MRLTLFVADLLRDTETQDAFVRDPKGLMTRANLSIAEQEIVLSRDRSKLADAVGHEIRHHLPDVNMPWPDRRPEIDSVTPSSGSQGQSVTLLVQGSFVSPDLARHLGSGAEPMIRACLSDGTTEIPSSAITNFIVNASSWSLQASFTLEGAKGHYSLQIMYQSTIAAIMSNAFTIT